MSDYRPIIEKMQTTIKISRGMNEETVRAAIINPVLKRLGWPSTQVLHNNSHDAGTPDYTLMKRNQIVLFIEAKGMEIKIGQNEDLKQILRYCSDKMVPFGVITNGKHWLLFKFFDKRVNLTDSIVWEINLEHDDSEIINDMFNALSRTTIENIEESSKKLQKKIKNQQLLKEARHKLMEGLWKKTVADHDQIIKVFTPIFKSHINKSDLAKYKIRDSQISEFVKSKIGNYFGNTGNVYPQIKQKSENEPAANSHPTYMIIKGEKIKITNVNRILIETANWLIRNGILQKSNPPISVSRGTRYLINSERLHKNNAPFVGSHTLINGLYIETNSDYETTVKYARKLFEQFGYLGTDIQFE
ncbi:MAG: type I restriction enzyme HsdR N-terminal domain-containing protein [Methanoregula sp.]|nr:type I restriction enzyme HsdR N-terminal domain-containing protein [Methanoregula sp.]